MAKKNKTSLVSIKQYAKDCRVTEKTVYNRIDDGSLSYTVISGTKFIDKSKHPAIPKKILGRPKADDLLAAL